MILIPSEFTCSPTNQTKHKDQVSVQPDEISSDGRRGFYAERTAEFLTHTMRAR
jgi:hypothetical protein